MFAFSSTVPLTQQTNRSIISCSALLFRSCLAYSYNFYLNRIKKKQTKPDLINHV